MNNTQPLLFDIPTIAETGVWCQLADGIDPGQWAGICRQIGQLSTDRFAEVQDFLNRNTGKSSHTRQIASPDSLFSRLKRIFCFNQAECSHLPLVSIGPESLNMS